MNDNIYDMKTDSLIDYFCMIIEDNDIKRSQLALDLGVDKNSMSMYLNKNRKMPLHVAIGLASQLRIDICKVCDIEADEGVKKENLVKIDLTTDEYELIHTLRNIESASIKDAAIKGFTNIVATAIIPKK